MTLYELYTLMGCDDKERLEVFNRTTDKHLIEKNIRFFIFDLPNKPEQYIVTDLSFSRKYVEVREIDALTRTEEEAVVVANKIPVPAVIVNKPEPSDTKKADVLFAVIIIGLFALLLLSAVFL